ncbi:MAG: hypothetical protein QF464_17905, partial [Myxococcota bacterium]|nr:hypothetical protein [Myxococcota bacterium]
MHRRLLLGCLIGWSLSAGCGGDAASAPTDALSDASTSDSARSDGASDLGGDAALADTLLPAPLAWSLVQDDISTGALFSIWSRDAEETWFVGGQLGSPLVLSLRGDDWTRHDPGFAQQAWWIHGWDDGSLMVVGDGGSVARYDGTTWTDLGVESLAGATLYGVWGATPDDVWAVGGPFLLAPEGVTQRDNVLVHFDGQSWSEVSLPSDVLGAGANLFKVWGTSS